MKKLNRQLASNFPNRPIKVVQFGEGNFLRAFVEYAFYKLNLDADFNAGIAVVQPIANGLVELLNEQDNLYTLFSDGIREGLEIHEKYLIDTIQKSINPYQDFDQYLDLAEGDDLQFIISNTTEAGISFEEKDQFEDAPASSFPGKLTQFLFHRFEHFQGESSKGLTILPCELINYNGDTLKKYILQYIDLWSLGSDFKDWINEHNTFHNTLVDRIVPGYPKNQLDHYESQIDYKDNLICTSEVFFLWVIEGGQELTQQLPFSKTNLQVKFVEDMQPYRTRKVRILNGAHTAMVPFSILYGNETVKETIDDDFTGHFVQEIIFEEIIPTLELDREELDQFGKDVLDRFRNPFIIHQLSSIALNSISKFKVRVLPSLLSFVESNGHLPRNLTFAFACLLQFYKGTWKGQALPINDSQDIVDFFQELWKTNDIEKVVQQSLSKVDYWGQDLTPIPKLKEQLIGALADINQHGIKGAYDLFFTNKKPIQS